MATHSIEILNHEGATSFGNSADVEIEVCPQVNIQQEEEPLRLYAKPIFPPAPLMVSSIDQTIGPLNRCFNYTQQVDLPFPGVWGIYAEVADNTDSQTVWVSVP